MERALSHLSLRWLELLCFHVGWSFGVLHLDWLASARVNTFVHRCDDLLSSHHHVLLVDRTGVCSDRIEHLCMGWVLDVPDTRGVYA